jgi:hypothetical protein
MTYFTYHLVPNYKQYILSSAKFRNVCYSLAEIRVRSAYLKFRVSLGWTVFICSTSQKTLNFILAAVRT